MRYLKTIAARTSVRWVLPEDLLTARAER